MKYAVFNKIEGLKEESIVDILSKEEAIIALRNNPELTAIELCAVVDEDVINLIDKM